MCFHYVNQESADSPLEQVLGQNLKELLPITDTVQGLKGR